MTAGPAAPIIISASRRTDIPAFYMDWFMDSIAKGSFAVKNPYNRRLFHVAATPADVHTIVFWSKNFRPFLDKGCGEILLRRGYHLFFNFTINSRSSWLEPGIPPLESRLQTLAGLCRRFGPQCINWRFDPVCVFRPPGQGIQDNLADFPAIAESAASMGIRRCITSFMDHYAKIEKRTARLPGFSFHDPPLEEKVRIIRWMEEVLAPLGIDLFTCCESRVLAALGPDTGVRASACISGRLLRELFGGNVSLRRDCGQRVKQGCGCTVSKDIGSYTDQPCQHNCLFCYANPCLQPAGEAGRA
ncbi:MAG TPA: DUF1848 family protein [Desulfosalsimonadaceae bacterium]|nr:DUF1848 family protein [Desulfosalsimonadaceae bacterium]